MCHEYKCNILVFATNLYTYKYNCMFCDSVTQFKSQALDLAVLKFIFYFSKFQCISHQLILAAG